MLHLAELRGQVPLVVQRIQCAARGPHRDAQQRHRPDDHAHPGIAETVDGEQLALAELGHVREDRHVQRRGHGLELADRAHRLGEDRIGSRVDERLGPVDRGIQPLDRPDVGARHDQEVLVTAGVGGCADALDRGVLVDHSLAVEVAAALGVDLVLDVRSREAGVLELLDRAGDIHRLPEAGVGVDDRGEVGHPGHLLRPPGDLGERGEADVGQAEVGGEHGARDVDPLEPLLLDQSGAQGVERAGEAQQLPGGEPFPEQAPLLGRRRGGVQHQLLPFDRCSQLRRPAGESAV